MAPATTRTTRSRYSSPYQASNGHSESSKGQGSGGGSTPVAGTDGPQQKFMRSWLEPPLNSQASYQDAGLQRHGVLEGMAPLGTMPKAGLFKKASAPVLPAPEKTTTPIRRIVLKRPAPETPPTPAPAVAPPAPEEDETEEEEDDGAVEGNDFDDESVRRRRSIQSRDDLDEEWAPGKGPYRGFSRRSMSRTSGGRMGSISSSSYQQTPALRLADLKEQIDRVVEKAVDEALALYRYPTAFALRTLYDEKCEDPDFLGLIGRVFRQTADREDLEEFRRLMSPRKKEGKKDNKGCYYFVPPSTDSRFPLHPPKPAPYSHLINFDLSVLRNEAELEPERGREPELTQEPEAEVELKQEPVPEPEVQPEPESVPEPVTERPGKRELSREEDQQEADPEKEAHIRKKRRSNRHSASAAKMSPNTVNGKAKTVSPAKRRTRANSQSSTSSLSSARSMTPPDGIQEDDEDADAFEAPPSRSSPAVEITRNTPVASKPTGRKGRRSLPPRKATKGNTTAERSASKSSTPARTPNPTTGSEEPAQDPQQATVEEAAGAEQPYDMPAVIDSPFFHHAGSRKGKSGANGVVFHSKVGKIDPNDPKLRLRQSARAVTNSYKATSDESYARDAPAEETAVPELAGSATPAGPSRARSSIPAARPTPATGNTRSTRSTRKRSHDELEEQASPTTVNFATSEAVPSTAANSRAGTPALRAAKKPRTGLRVKNSPVKKKAGTSAGIPRPSGERSSPGAVPKEDDNDDYCSSCGGNGELICCDGCTRSFHFNCVDPPLIQDSMPVEWFCNVCRSSRDAAALPTHSGAFAPLLEKIEAKNSSAFSLPLELRDLFEGVKTGADGEYEDIVPVVKPPPRKKKNDEDSVPDFFRLRDPEGNPVICHACQKSSSTNRAIVPCSLCGLYWHLDCLDPPLANPPPLRTWKCPCHVEEVLAKVPGTLAPAHRHRKIKGAAVIRPAFSRGYINNGYIEVDLNESDDESGWKDVETYGRTVRLPEKGIKLDFLARARANRKGKRIPPLSHAAPTRVPVVQQVADRASLEKHQAAYNLAQLSGQGTSGLDKLVDALLSEANPSVISLMARTDPEHMSSSEHLKNLDQQGLRAMLAQLERTTSHIRQLLDPSTPELLTPLPIAGSSGTTQTQLGRVPSLTHSQTDVESEAPQQTPRVIGLESSNTGKEKNLPSPAASDDADPTSRMSEKALTPMRDPEDQLVGSSPADEKSTADKDDMPVTPTDSRIVTDNDAVIVKGPQSDKTAVEIEDGNMDLD